MLNPMPNLIDSPFFMPKSVTTTDRHSSPTFSITFSLTDTPHFKEADMIDLEEETFHEKPLFHDPQTPSGPKEARRIPFRSLGAAPSMRTPPSDLFQVSKPKRLDSPTDEHPSSSSLLSSSPSVHATRRPTPIRVPSNVIGLPPIGSERRLRDKLLNDVDRLRDMFIEPPSPPGIPPRARKLLSHVHGRTTGPPNFLYVLAANKRKNPHAPTLVSHFNPLREYVPSCAWADKTIPLISARLRTPLSLLPLRSRSECDWATRDGRKTSGGYLKTFLHCRACRRDTLRTKVLVMNYINRQLHHVLHPAVPMGPFDDDDPDAMEIDDDLLDSPLLQDCDDFDDFDDSIDGSDALLPGGPGIEISHLSLF